MNKRIIAVALITLALGVGGGYWLASRHIGMSAKMNHSGTAPEQETKGKRKPLFYRSPMNPTVTSPVPAKDNMGMDYIPVYADGDRSKSEAAGTVRIDPTVVQNIGVRTAVAVSKQISHRIQTVGRVDYDEERMTRLHPKINGWIDKLFVSDTGTLVKRNTMLLALYSPELVTSEEEYLLALKNYDTLRNSPFPDIRKGAEDLLRSSRERLELLDVPKHQMDQLTKKQKVMKNLHIHSPFSGIVVHIGAREGQYVTPKTELYRIADLTKVWAYVDVYEYELPWVRVGDTAKMRLDALPGRVFTGKITYIYPYLDPKTRTNKVRLEFANRDMLLKPDMFADVTIMTSRRMDAVVIPTEAVLRTGETPRVFVVRAPGMFTPRKVRLGVSADNETQILEGVRPGERVVTSAQFLIDSESSLNEAAAKMVAPKKSTTEARRHREKKDMGGMQMDGMDMKGMKTPGMPPKKGKSHE